MRQSVSVSLARSTHLTDRSEIKAREPQSREDHSRHESGTLIKTMLDRIQKVQQHLQVELEQSAKGVPRWLAKLIDSLKQDHGLGEAQTTALDLIREEVLQTLLKSHHEEEPQEKKPDTFKKGDGEGIDTLDRNEEPR